jgi:hypothetical protein
MTSLTVHKLVLPAISIFYICVSHKISMLGSPGMLLLYSTYVIVMHSDRCDIVMIKGQVLERYIM